MAEANQSQHIFDLSKELMDDIELGRVEGEKLLFKCSRLARLAGSDEVQAWIGFETGGYYDENSISLKYMSLTGRWTNREEKKGYWGPLAQQQATVDALTIKLQALKLPSLSGDALYVSINNVIHNMNIISNELVVLGGIKTRVMALLHNFVSGIYYERAFSSLAKDTFEKYKEQIDRLLQIQSDEVLKKIPSVVDRLLEGDEEAVSQALTTCRRIIDAFADQIFPSSNQTIELGGNVLKLDASKHLNRINAYISQNTDSDSRRTRLRQNLSNLYNRVSTGVHADVTSDEAFSLFLNVYLFLGEVLRLKADRC